MQVTDSRADAFNDLLDIYGQIGRNQPSLSLYKELFVIEPDLTQLLSAIYYDIIQVHKLVVLYFQQRRKTSTSTNFGYVLTAISLDRFIYHDMEEAQVTVF